MTLWKKVLVAVTGLLCLVAPGARSQSFERQVNQISQRAAASAQHLRQNIAASQGRVDAAQDSAWNPADALDETKVGMAAKFIPIKPGTFDMGSPADEKDRDNNEDQHRVTLTKGFEMQATAVTQIQYFLVTARNPSSNREDCDRDNLKVMYGRGLCLNHPVENVSWKDAQKFIEQLNGMQDKCAYRLPTEAEREYAARGGTPSAFPYSFGYNDTHLLYHYAWFEGNSYGRTRPVATKRANPFGLHDMHGNVWEWVQDWYGYYPSTAVTDPTGPVAGTVEGPCRVMRGGAFDYAARSLRSADRSYDDPRERRKNVGFRLVRSCR